MATLIASVVWGAGSDFGRPGPGAMLDALSRDGPVRNLADAERAAGRFADRWDLHVGEVVQVRNGYYAELLGKGLRSSSTRAPAPSTWSSTRRRCGTPGTLVVDPSEGPEGGPVDETPAVTAQGPPVWGWPSSTGWSPPTAVRRGWRTPRAAG
ncbi:hypothetical protein OG390_01940 [Streptomyces sp. NBC_00996]|nr:hypothetical protein OG390_01940 [Streptomyces sp. NBC_00996]